MQGKTGVANSGRQREFLGFHFCPRPFPFLRIELVLFVERLPRCPAKPGAAAGEMDIASVNIGARMTIQPVPFLGQRADVILGDPHEIVQPCPALGADVVDGQEVVCWVRAIP